jgi:hypothetical protein
MAAREHVRLGTVSHLDRVASPIANSVVPALPASAQKFLPQHIESICDAGSPMSQTVND